MSPLALISAPGPMEMGLILVLVMIFFGVGKLPEVGKAIGRSIKQFKDAQKDDAMEVSTEQLMPGDEVVEPVEERKKTRA